MIGPLFADQLVIEALKDEDPTGIYWGKIQNPGTRQTVVLGTGGGALSNRRNWEHQITFTVWGKDVSDYLWVNSQSASIISRMDSWAEDGWLGETPLLYLAWMSIPYRDPDPVSAIHRESFSVRLHLRGRE